MEVGRRIQLCARLRAGLHPKRRRRHLPLEAFRALQSENKRLKEAIESEWDQAGLPTFLRYLKDYIRDRAAAGSADA